jgi:hypothetical protein
MRTYTHMHGVEIGVTKLTLKMLIVIVVDSEASRAHTL